MAPPLVYVGMSRSDRAPGLGFAPPRARVCLEHHAPVVAEVSVVARGDVARTAGLGRLVGQSRGGGERGTLYANGDSVF